MPAERLRGMAPNCRLISLRVLNSKGEGRSSDVIRALDYIREQLNDNPKLLRVHGVNLSVGYEFDAEMFACGQSPLCAEVNRLVQSGVVVVAAAGNTGYGTVAAQRARDQGRPLEHHQRSGQRRAGDHRRRDAPRLAAHLRRLVLLVEGSDRRRPAEAGPRGAGRAHHVVRRRRQAEDSDRSGAASAEPPTAHVAYYVEDSGTSMAAPHVSGAIAAFLSIRREFIGRPLEVKRIFRRRRPRSDASGTSKGTVWSI